MDPSCSHLKAAMMGGYRYKPTGDNVIDKNKHSHVAEALQYLCLHLNAASGDYMYTHLARRIKPVPSYGWT